jgi:hypothetical protein
MKQKLITGKWAIYIGVQFSKMRKNETDLGIFYSEFPCGTSLKLANHP